MICSKAFTSTRLNSRDWALTFLSNLYGEIESLQLYAGVHEKLYKDYRRLLAHRFPFAIYYTVENESVSIHAVVDCRKNPTWMRKRLI